MSNFIWPRINTSISGAVDQGAPNTEANAWPVKITDGVTVVGVTLGGAVKSSIIDPLPAGGNVIGGVTQSGGPWTVNLTQLLGSAPGATNPLASQLSDGASFYDARQIRALTNVDVVTVEQGTNPWIISAASLPLPTGAATEATLSALNAKVSLGVQLAAASIAVVLASDQAPLPVTQSGVWSVGRTWALGSGTDSVDAVQSGAWSVAVNNFPATQPVSGTVTANQGTSPWVVDGSGVTQPISAASLPLPTGASTEATLVAISGKLPATLGQKTMANSLAVVLASDQTAIPVTQSGAWSVSVSNFPATQAVTQSGNWSVRNQDGAGNDLTSSAVGSNRALHTNNLGKAFSDSAVKNSGTVTSGAWTQLIASTAAESQGLLIFDSSGVSLELGIGAAAAETRVLIIPPGGLNGFIPLRIPAGSRVSVRAISTTADYTASELLLTLIG